MTSLFKQPDGVVGVTFMLRGEAGTGKTRFALGAKRVAGTVAYIGTDRGAKFYKDDPEVGGFLQVESRDVKVVRAAIQELTASQAKGFGAVVVDTVTDLWEGEQTEYIREGKKGKYIPLNAWKPMRNAHEALLRSLQALPVHAFLICEEKPIYLRVGGDDDGEAAELKEIGTKEDADKKDSYVSDVRLRFFIEKKKFRCEVLKDRTGTFKMGTIVDDPRPEMWIKAPADRAAVPPPPSNGNSENPEPALLASIFVRELAKLDENGAIDEWLEKHKGERDSLPPELKALVNDAGKAARKRAKKAAPEERQPGEEG